jgi:hypothetical protein
MISDAQFKRVTDTYFKCYPRWAMVTIVRWLAQFSQGTAKLLVKDDGIIAGVEFAK